MSEQDDFAERFHRDRRQHGGASQYLDNDQDEQLARLTEEERVAAGLDAYDPDEVPRPPTRRRSRRTSRRTRTGRKSGPSSAVRRTRTSWGTSTSTTRSRQPGTSDRSSGGAARRQ